MRLLYMYVYQNQLFEDFAINFTTDYDIYFEDDDKSKIVIKQINDTFNVVKYMYSKYIHSISALVGINGVGKTTILNYLGISDDQTDFFYKEATYFMLYEMNGCLFIECKEGNEKLKFLECDDYKEWNYTERHWWLVNYLDKEKKLETVYDAKWECINTQIRFYAKSIQFFYYNDYTANSTGWTKPYTYQELLLGDDGNSYLERKKISNSLYGIYRFFSLKGRMLKEILESRKEIECVVRINEDTILVPWQYKSEDDLKRSFILQYLVSILIEGSRKKSEIKRWVKEISQNIPGKSNREKYKFLKGILLNKLKKERHAVIVEDVENLIVKLEKIQAIYFRQSPRLLLQQGMVCAKEIYFNTLEAYNDDLYAALCCICEVNEMYKVIEYEYEAMSAGEAKCVDVFAGLYSVIGDGENIKGKNIVILLDEPDKGMHPEMARHLMNIINDFSDELGKNMGCTFQYIFATHSPFLTLDIPSNGVYRLEKNNGKTRVTSQISGVLTNVVDLIKDTFYLKSAFGVLAEKYFKTIQKEIMGINKTCTKDEIIMLKSRIDIIKEPSLQKYLNVKLEEKLENICGKEEMVQYYRNKIRELEKND